MSGFGCFGNGGWPSSSLSLDPLFTDDMDSSNGPLSNGEHRLGISPKAGSSSSSGVQFFNPAHRTRKQFAFPNSSKAVPGRPSSTTVPSFREDEKCASETRATRMNFNNASKKGPLHGAESTEKIDVSVMIKTMHNLSDLLRHYSSNDVCALKEQDRAGLKHVIDNLNACILNIDEQMTSARGSAFAQKCTSHLLGESPYLHQGAGVDWAARVKKELPVNAMNELEQWFQRKMPNIMLGREYKKLSEFISKRNNAEDIVKTNEMTQALKKVLAENFHGEEETHPQALLYKNLWLEAEAALCSTNYKPRFDRMKNEMEKCKPHEAKAVSEDSMDEENLLKSKVNPDIITANKLASETKSGIQDSPIINKTTLSEEIIARLPKLKVCPDIITANKLASETKSGTPDSPIINNATLADEVIARCQDDNSSFMNTMDTVKVSDSNVVPNLTKVDKTAPQAYDGSDSDIYVEWSPISSITSHVDDVEDSVMAKRGELKEGTFTVGRDLLHHIDGCSEDKLTVRKSGADMDDDDDDDDDMSIKSSRTEGLEDQQRPPSLDECFLNEWVHVLK